MIFLFALWSSVNIPLTCHRPARPPVCPVVSRWHPSYRLPARPPIFPLWSPVDTPFLAARPTRCRSVPCGDAAWEPEGPYDPVPLRPDRGGRLRAAHQVVRTADPRQPLPGAHLWHEAGARPADVGDTPAPSARQRLNDGGLNDVGGRHVDSGRLNDDDM